MHARNLIVLVSCQLISATATISLVTLGGIIGASLTSNKALVTLPLSLMVVAVAALSIGQLELHQGVAPGLRQEALHD